MTDFSQLGDSALVEGLDHKPDPPAQVAGRVLHIDADFLAYHCGYRYEEESLDKSIETLKQEAEALRIMAGATMAVLHTTMGSKGGRYEIARVKEYQTHRKEKPPGLVERVGELRAFMAEYNTSTIQALPQMEQEADDSICQCMWGQRDSKNPPVMWSLDKDLYMVGGLHLNPKTYELEEFPWGYGSCELDRDGSSAKVVGKGTSFFWHQLLMGDSADAIPGLPFISVGMKNEFFPTAALKKALARVDAAKTPKQAKTARAAVKREAEKAKPKSCGAVTAFELLRGARNDRRAFEIVCRAYTEYYGEGKSEHQHWDGSTYEAFPGDMLLEQARLLWMRRTPNQDVLDWMKETLS